MMYWNQTSNDIYVYYPIAVAGLLTASAGVSATTITASGALSAVGVASTAKISSTLTPAAGNTLVGCQAANVFAEVNTAAAYVNGMCVRNAGRTGSFIATYSVGADGYSPQMQFNTGADATGGLIRGAGTTLELGASSTVSTTIGGSSLAVVGTGSFTGVLTLDSAVNATRTSANVVDWDDEGPFLINTSNSTYGFRISSNMEFVNIGASAYRAGTVEATALSLVSNAGAVVLTGTAGVSTGSNFTSGDATTDLTTINGRITQVAAAPTWTAGTCNDGTESGTGDDEHGTITGICDAGETLVVTFSATYTTTPVCTITATSAISAVTTLGMPYATPAATTLTITLLNTSASQAPFTYGCRK
jgi:hypothetical protein